MVKSLIHTTLLYSSVMLPISCSRKPPPAVETPSQHSTHLSQSTPPAATSSCHSTHRTAPTPSSQGKKPSVGGEKHLSTIHDDLAIEASSLDESAAFAIAVAPPCYRHSHPLMKTEMTPTATTVILLK